MSAISRGSLHLKGFINAEMEFQMLRQMGAAAYKAASVGECIHAMNSIRDGSPAEWVQSFEKLGEWQKEDGLERMVKNHVISGREQLFKASNSFRAAEYYSSCTSEQHQHFGILSADCFCTAISSMDLHFENHAVPFKTINLPVYFISPANDGAKRKTIMIVSGFDGTLEEECMLRGLAALERNYNVILFAGPGQMDVLRRYPQSKFIPDFEQVVTRIINHFEYRQEIDMHMLSLMGISLGGYFATRAAAHEPRIRALIANSPILDLHHYLTSLVGFDPAKMPDSDDFSLEKMKALPESEMSAELKIRTELLILRYGQETFKKTFQYLKEFNVGEAIHQIKCPTLALVGEDEGSEPRNQFDAFVEATEGDSYVFTNFEGAGSHCQVGNLNFANAVVYDWLDNL